MAKMTIEKATTQINRLKERVEKLKREKKMLQTRITNRETLIEEARQIITSIGVISNAVKRHKG